MMNVTVERLLTNYKTLEEFKHFKQYGIQELSMLEDLQENIIENNSESPFYGIRYGDKLVARMSLYKVESKFDRTFNPPQDYLELHKLEVLPGFQKKGYGKILVDFAKKSGMPIITNPRVSSDEFWEKMGFKPLDPAQCEEESCYAWYPDGVTNRNDEKNTHQAS